MELTKRQAAQLEREALRVYARYQREVVEAFGFCPWAVRAREEGHVRPVVVLRDDLATVAAQVEALARDPSVHVGLVLLPLSSRDRLAHERFVAAVRERHAKAHGGSPPLAMAAFHPDAEADLASPARLVPFIRRTPDPTLQLVRLQVLEELRRPFERGTDYVDPTDLGAIEALLATPSKKPLHERIAQTNLDTVRRRGVDAVRARLQAIRADRDATYAAILRPS